MTDALSLISHVATVPAALKALAAMEKQLDATSYAEIHKVIDGSRALKMLFRDVKIVKHGAEDMILVAGARIGEEIKRVRKATGRQPKNVTRKLHSKGRGKLGISAVARSHYMKLADNKPKLKSIANKLRAKGKNASTAAVLREINKSRKKPVRNSVITPEEKSYWHLCNFRNACDAHLHHLTEADLKKARALVMKTTKEATHGQS
jgi:hypothetical protein